MLGCGGNSVTEVVALEALDVGGPDGPCEHRILAVGLLYPPPAGVTSDIEDGSQRVPGTDCYHLGTDDLGHLLNQGRVPGRSESNALGKNRCITMAEPTRGLLVNDDRDAEPRTFDGHLLDCIHERCTFLWMEAGRGTNARHLPNAVRHLLDDGIGVEGTSAHESGAPDAAELSQLLVQRHESEQVFDAVFNGGVRVTIE